MKRNHTVRLTVNALSIALVCVTTMIIQIPIPLGYMNLGNCMILLIGYCFGKKTGAVAGSIGSALADLLTGYPQWILPTLLIKCLMGYLVGAIAKDHAKAGKMLSRYTAAGAAAGILIMIIGYTVAGAVLYGSLPAGLAQLPGLAIEGTAGIILFYIIGMFCESVQLPKLLNKYV